MLAVIAIWGADTVDVAEVQDHHDRIGGGFRKINPRGADVIERALTNGEIDEPGTYVITRLGGIPTGVERKSDI